MSEFSSNVGAANIWEKTFNLRIVKTVNYYVDEAYYNSYMTETLNEVLQQQSICKFTGETKWEPVEVVYEKT